MNGEIVLVWSKILTITPEKA